MTYIYFKLLLLFKTNKNLLNQSNVWPRSEPALELYSRAASNVGVMYRSRGPNTGSNPVEGRIKKCNWKIEDLACLMFLLSVFSG